MELRKQTVGTRYYTDDPVTATDPCYESGTWCTVKNISVIPGDYECVAWMGKETYHNPFTGKSEEYDRVRICGIYLAGEGLDDDWEDWELIGHAGVDAGLCGFYQNKPDYNDEEWSAFCRAIDHADYLITKEGFCTQSGDGDGNYPVYAHKDGNGNIDALEIRF